MTTHALSEEKKLRNDAAFQALRAIVELLDPYSRKEQLMVLASVAAVFGDNDAVRAFLAISEADDAPPPIGTDPKP
jgi:hypothetical protein